MNDYSQPAFYRFNEDSLKLVKFVLTSVSQADHILDMGAGSGVIGIELANHYKCSLTLLEVQSEFRSHLGKNVDEQLKSGTAEIIESSFGEWKTGRQFDLIVSNPPYFLPDHGQPNADIRKNIARSFIVDDWKIFLSKIDEAMSGRAFLVVKNDLILKQLIEKNWKHQSKFTEEGKIVFVELFRLNVD